MAVADEYIKKYQAEARFHVQVELLSVSHMERVDNQFIVLVSCRVVRVFRGHPELEVGSLISFSVLVLPEDMDIVERPIGPFSYMCFEELQVAKYMEVFLDGTPQRCYTTDFQVGMKLLDAPTDTALTPCPV